MLEFLEVVLIRQVLLEFGVRILVDYPYYKCEQWVHGYRHSVSANGNLWWRNVSSGESHEMTLTCSQHAIHVGNEAPGVCRVFCKDGSQMLLWLPIEPNGEGLWAHYLREDEHVTWSKHVPRGKWCLEVER
jgi:hypothetical protein